MSEVIIRVVNDLFSNSWSCYLSIQQINEFSFANDLVIHYLLSPNIVIKMRSKHFCRPVHEMAGMNSFSLPAELGYSKELIMRHVVRNVTPINLVRAMSSDIMKGIFVGFSI